MPVILIKSSDNLEDYKESQERICDVAGGSTSTLLMWKLRFTEEKRLRSLPSRTGELELDSGSHAFLPHLSAHYQTQNNAT